MSPRAKSRTASPFRWKPAHEPARLPIRGRSVTLEPLKPRDHAATLYQATHGPGHDKRLWDYMFVGPFIGQADFAMWLAACAESEDPLFFAIVDKQRGALGMVSFMRINPGHGVIELGNIFFAAPLQKSRGATEAIFLMLRQCFERWGYRRVEWKCDARNSRSQRAALRFGFQPEGYFRQHMVIKGQSRDTAWFAVIDRDWPKLREAYRRWLAPANFDSDGAQRMKLKARTRRYSPRAPARRH
jgi:RimJ/RimL family protein N-acetyltransferase